MFRSNSPAPAPVPHASSMPLFGRTPARPAMIGECRAVQGVVPAPGPLPFDVNRPEMAPAGPVPLPTIPAMPGQVNTPKMAPSGPVPIPTVPGRVLGGPAPLPPVARAAPCIVGGVKLGCRGSRLRCPFCFTLVVTAVRIESAPLSPVQTFFHTCPNCFNHLGTTTEVF